MSMESVAWSAMWRAQRGSIDDHPFSRESLSRIWRFARPYRAQIAVFVALSVVTSALAVATPLLAGDVIDVITDGGPVGVVVRIAVLIAAIAVAEAGLGVLARWFSSRLGEDLIADLRTAVFDHVQQMPIAFFTRTRTGALVSRINNDVIAAQSAFASTLSGIVGNVVTLTLTLIAMVALSWQVTLAALVLLPVFVIPARRVGRRLAGMRREAADHNAAMNDQATERFSAPGATLVKLYGRPEVESRAFSDRVRRVRDIGVRTAMLQTAFVTALTLVSALALALVYGLGGALAVAGSLQVGDVVALALLITRLYAPLTSLASARVDVMSAVVAFDRVFEILSLVPLVRDPDEPKPVPAGPLALEVADVSFGYPSAEQVSLASLEDVAVLDNRGGQTVLHDVAFRADPGSLVALVGSSGAGKSTLAQLLVRLYDVDAGSIRLGGVDVRDLAAADLHRAVGLVTQDGHLFHTTIRENLLLGAPAASDREVWDALERARLADLVATLPDGLDTVVGERGYRLSGGERQRLTIARLLLRAPRAVILDEATAHLDSANEAAVTAALAEALTDRTAIVIAHRLSTVRAADLILVLEDGRVVEQGRHPDLLARGGRYAELYRTQFDVEPETPTSAQAGDRG
jgi:ATP-binding cassette subfamily B protein